MGKLLETLERYFEDTPKELLEKDSIGWDSLNEIGPDVLDYAQLPKADVCIDMVYRVMTDACEGYAYQRVVTTNAIMSDASYYLTA